MGSYEQVPADEEDEDDVFSTSLDEDIELTDISTKIAMEGDEDDEEKPSRFRVSLELLEEQLLYNVWNRWEEPCLLSALITLILVVPTLVLWSLHLFAFTGRLWGIWIFVLHLQMRLAHGSWYIYSVTTISFRNRQLLRRLCAGVTLLEVALCAGAYPKVANLMMDHFYRDVDGTWILEWKSEVMYLRLTKSLGWLVVLSRAAVGLPALWTRGVKIWSPDDYREWRPVFMDQETLSDSTQKVLSRGFRGMNYATACLHVVCLFSAVSHFGPWPQTTIPQDCDPLDTTECALPFPSFHHMRRDHRSITGWKVDLKGLPPLRGGIPFHPKFLNELDGFSTMAPILFYMEGMKEAHERRKSQKNGDGNVSLQGIEDIASSVTKQSITLLLNINTGELVPHSAEVDYLDADHPLIMVNPARPLHHATHYAVVVMNAEDAQGRALQPTQGMKDLWKDKESERRKRYKQKILPALAKAAPWMTDPIDKKSMQLLFDFVTASADSQIGPLRKVRDITMDHIAKWAWKDHMSIVSDIYHSCDRTGDTIARTLHVSLDVPWFLRHPKSRLATLDHWTMEAGKPLGIHKAKAIIRYPCSLEKETLGRDGGVPLRAIVEYGHGIFGNREEIQQDFLSDLANRNGYVLMAMDWRGMSIYDLPVVIKTLLGNAKHFQAVRDNLIQGYANKLVLQHFAQNYMLDRFKFQQVKIPTLNQEPPVSVFYGISQGGILGAGYVAASGPTKLIDRAILGVPGTPFASLLARSLDFVGYDGLMLLNCYNNRQARILLTLFQMGWDSVEAAGLLAQPVSEPLPRVLLQAGLGDAEVPTFAAENLARAMQASLLSGNPRDVYGVPRASAANKKSLGPDVTLTEVLYEKEYASLPIDDTQPASNNVHVCVRRDEALIGQLEEFVNTGRIIDPCVEDQCRREHAKC